jgi:putative two-component system response regulator
MDPAKILIVDDDVLVSETVSTLLEIYNHKVTVVNSGHEALNEVNEDFDVIILDINMPEMDGFETLTALNKRKLQIPVLFLTGAGSLEYAVKAINLGAYDFIAKPVQDADLFHIKVLRALEKRNYIRQQEAYRYQLEMEVEKKTRELARKNELLQQYSQHLEVATVNTILTLQTALEEKDVYTAGHTSRVTEYSLKIGSHLNLPEDEMEVLRRAAQLHDIGKLVIDSTAIEKPGPLTPEEWVQVKKHPLVGENIISRLGYLSRESRIIRGHHERIDGKGYPASLHGDELDTLTKVVTVADSYDAMTSTRCYKKNKTRSEAITELQLCAGSQFDPMVVEAFVDLLTEESIEQQVL